MAQLSTEGNYMFVGAGDRKGSLHDNWKTKLNENNCNKKPQATNPMSCMMLATEHRWPNKIEELLSKGKFGVMMKMHKIARNERMQIEGSIMQGDYMKLHGNNAVATSGAGTSAAHVEPVSPEVAQLQADMERIQANQSKTVKDNSEQAQKNKDKIYNQRMLTLEKMHSTHSKFLFEQSLQAESQRSGQAINWQAVEERPKQEQQYIDQQRMPLFNEVMESSRPGHAKEDFIQFLVNEFTASPHSKGKGSMAEGVPNLNTMDIIHRDMIDTFKSVPASHFEIQLKKYNLEKYGKDGKNSNNSNNNMTDKADSANNDSEAVYAQVMQTMSGSQNAQNWQKQHKNARIVNLVNNDQHEPDLSGKNDKNKKKMKDMKNRNEKRRCPRKGKKDKTGGKNKNTKNKTKEKMETRK